MDSYDQQEVQDNQEELNRVFPPFKTWSQLYAFVLAELVALIFLFYLFSKAFA